MCAWSRNSAFYQDFLQLEEQANPEGMIYVITDNLSSHASKSTRAWLEDHPRIRHAFIPRAPAGSTCKRAGGGSSGARRWPGSPSPTPTRSPTPPRSPPPSSTPRPALDLGTAPAQATLLPPALCVHPLRNLALAELAELGPAKAGRSSQV
jgi:hypothetical protein